MEYSDQTKVELAKLLPERFQFCGKDYSYVYHSSNLTQDGLLVNELNYNGVPIGVVLLDFDRVYEIVYEKEPHKRGQVEPIQVESLNNLIENDKILEEDIPLAPPPIPKINEPVKTVKNERTYNKDYKLTRFNAFFVSKSLRFDWQHQIWIKCKYGILTFCLFNFAFEIIFAEGKTNFIWPVIVNYIISAWYLGRKVAKGKMYQKPYLTGLLVAFVIFMLRLFIGTLFIVYNYFLLN